MLKDLHSVGAALIVVEYAEKLVATVDLGAVGLVRPFTQLDVVVVEDVLEVRIQFLVGAIGNVLGKVIGQFTLVLVPVDPCKQGLAVDDQSLLVVFGVLENGQIILSEHVGKIGLQAVEFCLFHKALVLIG